MKRRKLKPRKGSAILLMGVYVRSNKSDFECTDWYIFYWDKKRRRLFEEEGMNVTRLMQHRGDVIPEGMEYYQSWARKRKERSVSALLRKIDEDFEGVFGLFDEYSVDITEVGKL